MSVEEPVSFLFPGQAHDDGRLDDADFADGGSDPAVLDRPPHWFGHGAQKLDLATRNSQAGPFQGQFDFARLFASGHCTPILLLWIRPARPVGIAASASLSTTATHVPPYERWPTVSPLKLRPLGV